MAKNTIFELNGKAYDALSGALLGDTQRPTHTSQVQHMPVRQRSAGSVDGMVTGHQHKPHQPATTKHLTAHRPQPTKTLMRHALRPPQPTTLHPNKATTATGLQSQTALQPKQTIRPTITPKLSTGNVDPIRAHRARTVNRSRAVEHFRPARHLAAHHIQPAPIQQLPQQHTSLPHATHHPTPEPQRPAAVNRHRLAPTQQEDDLEQDLFAQALAAARSHEEPAPHESATQIIKRKSRKGRRILAVTASLATFLALCGFVAFQNRDQIQLQMASAKAGFAASAPLYMPQGYDMEKMSYATGTVAASFRHPTQPAFVILQKKSNWDSQTLLENFVATSDEEYRGFQSNGRTVYVYGKGKATWVNGGIWYQIKNANSLTDEQLVRIAASM